MVLREAARHFFNMKRYERARTVLEQAYQASQGDPETAYLLSLFFVRVADEKLRDLDKAVIYGDFAATARPNEPRYVSALAEVAHARGEKEKAVELVERARARFRGAQGTARGVSQGHGREGREDDDSGKAGGGPPRKLTSRPALLEGVSRCAGGRQL